MLPSDTGITYCLHQTHSHFKNHLASPRRTSPLLLTLLPNMRCFLRLVDRGVIQKQVQAETIYRSYSFNISTHTYLWVKTVHVVYNYQAPKHQCPTSVFILFQGYPKRLIIIGMFIEPGIWTLQEAQTLLLSSIWVAAVRPLILT